MRSSERSCHFMYSKTNHAQQRAQLPLNPNQFTPQAITNHMHSQSPPALTTHAHPFPKY
jgi:hypothetical protein